MANSITIRTTAPGAKEAATDLDKVKTSAQGLGTLGKAGLLGLGAAATAGFGLATKGALEAQTAQGNFMAATGKSREEAKKFVTGMDSLAGSAGAVGKSFDEISRTGTMVEQQFGTTGQATTDLTELVLEFAKVTGQDAEQAAGDLDDTLTAYGLSAEDAAGFTDQLVASTQKYGVDVGPAQLDLLRKISPALQTMGGDVNDATGYLVAMEQAGIDATDAAKAFNGVLDKVPDGTTIDDLVKHFADLKSQGIDPTKEAIELFGKKAGPAFLKAIQPGMDGLDDLTVSAKDAKGAVHDGAEAMVTDADKIKGAFEKLAAGAREIGQDFGPALMGIGTLGSAVTPLAGGVKDVLKKALPMILPAAAESGAAIGAAEAAGASSSEVLGKWGNAGKLATGAFQAGALVAAPAAGGLIVKAISDDLNAKGALSDFYDSIFGDGADMAAKGAQWARVMDQSLAGGMTFEQAQEAATKWMTDQYGPAAGEAFANSFKATTTTQLATHIQSERAENAMVEFGVTLGDKAADGTKQGWQDAQPELTEAFKNSAMGLEGDLASALKNNTSVIDDAMDAVTYAVEHPMELTQQKANLAGAITTLEYKRGIEGDGTELATVLDQQINTLKAQWLKLTGIAYDEGVDAAHAWKNGYVNQYAKGIVNLPGYNRNPGDDHNHGNAPRRAGGGPVTAGMPYTVGEEGMELFVPNQNGTILPHRTSGGGGGWGGGSPVTVNIYGFYGGQGNLAKLGQEIQNALRQGARGSSRNRWAY